MTTTVSAQTSDPKKMDEELPPLEAPIPKVTFPNYMMRGIKVETYTKTEADWRREEKKLEDAKKERQARYMSTYETIQAEYSVDPTPDEVEAYMDWLDCSQSSNRHIAEEIMSSKCKWYKPVEIPDMGYEIDIEAELGIYVGHETPKIDVRTHLGNVVDPAYDLLRWGSVKGYETYNHRQGGPYHLTHEKYGECQWVQNPDGAREERGNRAFLLWALENWFEAKTPGDGWYLLRTVDRWCLALTTFPELWVISPRYAITSWTNANRFYRQLIEEAARGEDKKFPQLLARDFDRGTMCDHPDPMYHTLPYATRSEMAKEYRLKGKLTTAQCVPWRPTVFHSYVSAVNDHQLPRADKRPGMFHLLGCTNPDGICARNIEELYIDAEEIPEEEEVRHETGWMYYPTAGTLSHRGQFITVEDLVEGAGSAWMNLVAEIDKPMVKGDVFINGFSTYARDKAMSIRRTGARLDVSYVNHYAKAAALCSVAPKLGFEAKPWHHARVRLIGDRDKIGPTSSTWIASGLSEDYIYTHAAKSKVPDLKEGGPLPEVELDPYVIGQLAEYVQRLDPAGTAFIDPPQGLEGDPHQCDLRFRDASPYVDPMCWIFGWKTTIPRPCECISAANGVAQIGPDIGEKFPQPKKGLMKCSCGKTVIRKTAWYYDLVPVNCLTFTDTVITIIEPDGAPYELDHTGNNHLTARRLTGHAYVVNPFPVYLGPKPQFAEAVTTRVDYIGVNNSDYWTRMPPWIGVNVYPGENLWTVPPIYMLGMNETVGWRDSDVGEVAFRILGGKSEHVLQLRSNYVVPDPETVRVPPRTAKGERIESAGTHKFTSKSDPDGVGHFRFPLSVVRRLAELLGIQLNMKFPNVPALRSVSEHTCHGAVVRMVKAAMEAASYPMDQLDAEIEHVKQVMDVIRNPLGQKNANRND